MHQIPQTAEEARSICKEWNSIYPAYLNKMLSIQQGRRISQEIAVDNPTIQEMSECLEHLKIHHVVELDKAYPKEWYNSGRIKVYIKNKQGQLFNPLFKTKKQILVKIASMIPQCKSRGKILEKEKQQTNNNNNAKNKKKKKK